MSRTSRRTSGRGACWPPSTPTRAQPPGRPLPACHERPALPGDELLGSRLTIRLLALLLGALLLWSALFTLDIASHSTGEVTSLGQTKLVQHLEGGIVRRILVREGQRVTAGEPLAEVERVSTLSEGRETEALLGALRIRAIRLEAQLAGADDMQVPEELARDFAEQVKVNRDLFIAQKSRLGSRYEEQQQKIAQRNAEEKELKARRAHANAKLKLLRQQIAISEKLMKEGLANRYEHLELLKDEEQLRGTLQETEASLGRVLAAQKQEQAALTSLDSGGNEELQKELAEARRQVAELQERLHKYSDSRERQVVRSPIEGVVMTLQVNTEGGVIQPGGTLMTLVPADEPMLVETRLPVGDIGMVSPGQTARIQLVSSIARGFQPIDGEVVDISRTRCLTSRRCPTTGCASAPRRTPSCTAHPLSAAAGRAGERGHPHGRALAVQLHRWPAERRDASLLHRAVTVRWLRNGGPA